jgi:carbonic anhydrase
MSEPRGALKRRDFLPWVIPEQCEACADCVSACPVYGLEMWETDNPDFSIPWLSNPDTCIGCGKCEEACAWGAINMTGYLEDARKRLFTKQPHGLKMRVGLKKFNLRDAAKKKIAIITCLDSRLHVEEILRENRDNAYVLRNAGNSVTDCAIRSLTLCVDVLGAREIVLIGHRMCGLRMVDARKLQDTVETRIESKVSEMMGKPFRKWLQLDSDPENHIRTQAAIIRSSKVIPRDIPITGLIYDEFNGHISQVLASDGKLSE